MSNINERKIKFIVRLGMNDTIDTKGKKTLKEGIKE